MMAVIRIYDEAGNVVEMHEHKDEFSKNRRIILASLGSR
jgi:hypothetical protein